MNDDVSMSVLSLGKNIRALRKSRGITISQLAELTGSDVGNLSRIERGVQWPSERVLVSLSTALKAPISDFFMEKAPACSTSSVNARDRLLVAALESLYRERVAAYRTLEKTCLDAGGSMPDKGLFGIDEVKAALLDFGVKVK